MFVSFIYIVAGINISFFIIGICSGLYVVDQCVFRHSPHDESLDSVSIGAIENNIAISSHALMGSIQYRHNLPKATESVSLQRHIDL